MKVCVKLAALSAEWPGRRKTYGPGEKKIFVHCNHPICIAFYLLQRRKRLSIFYRNRINLKEAP